MNQTHTHYMQLAIEQARLAQAINEVPVGAVLVQDDKLIAAAHNQPIQNNDPTAHAEIQLLRAAGKTLNNYRLPNTTLYVTLEPCTMCAGAMIYARIKRVVFGAPDPRTGTAGSAIDLFSQDYHNHRIEVEGGVMQEECGQILKDFFRERRKK
jgi:tRNA(adenine34) deaminase